jgi:Delta3,5-Delta2,4-dienoyl-CoA isomerase
MDAGNLSKSNNMDAARQGFALQRHIKEFQHCIGIPEQCPFPVIAALHGNVIGLGVDMSSYCDIRICASNTTFMVKVHNHPSTRSTRSKTDLFDRKWT